MAKPELNEFQSYKFDTSQEEMQGQILTEANIFFIRNQLAKAMQERAVLTYDPLHPITTFVQQEAALMGQINAFRFLLDAHEQVIAGLSQLDD